MTLKTYRSTLPYYPTVRMPWILAPVLGREMAWRIRLREIQPGPGASGHSMEHRPATSSLVATESAATGWQRLRSLPGRRILVKADLVGFAPLILVTG